MPAAPNNQAYTNALQGYKTTYAQTGPEQFQYDNQRNYFVNEYAPSLGVSSQQAASDFDALGFAQPQQSTIPSGVPTGGGGGGVYGGGGSDTRSLINSAFDSKRSGLQKLLDSFTPQKQEAKQQVNRLAGRSTDKLELAKTQGLRATDTAEDTLERNRDLGVRSIASNTRNVIDSFNRQLGTVGAADSSTADVIAPYAIANQSNQARSDFLRGVTDNQNQINMRRTEIEENFGSELADIELWQNNQLSQLDSEFRGLEAQIQQEMANSDSERQLALAELSQQLASSYVQRANTVQQAAEQGANQVAQKYSGLSGPQVNAGALQGGPLQNTLSVQRQNAPTLQGARGNATQSTYNPLLLGRSDRNIQPASYGVPAVRRPDQY